ncbi:MAG: phosphate acyltransferase PlsX [Ruminococcaceae bacterium]|nr:phosphate acyltransferase PlsX [Oscillospiraceae bacterium]
MKIIIDAMSGDNAPTEIVRGAVLAAKTLKSDNEYILVGDTAAVTKELEAAGGMTYLQQKRITVAHADEVLTMEDDPFDVIKKKKNSSMSVALRMLADGEGDALVSAGNTGALFTGASMIVRCVKGIRRAGIAALIPFERPLLLMDAGANVTVTAEYLEQFALMGSVYMEKLFSIESPSVGLANNGTESHKGTPVIAEAYEKLSANTQINFVGNVEGKEVPFGKCDVLVADGFTGNVILKLIEGMGSFFMKRMKRMLYANVCTKLSALVLKKELMQLKRDFDASEAGGSPFLGIQKPVIKAHGSSDARAIMNACRQAASYVERNVNDEIIRRAAQNKRAAADTAAAKTSE